MRIISIQSDTSRAILWLLALIGLFGVAVSVAPHARADAVAYVVNVTMRPGYNFPNADAALAYGHNVCDKVTAGSTYSQIMQGALRHPRRVPGLVSDHSGGQRIVSGLVWQLRNSAAHYPSANRMIAQKGDP
jgi:hypothetical protein